MYIEDLVEQINTLADEDYEPEIVINYINDAIANINAECDANFPFIDTTFYDEYTAIPDTWQRILFIPFALGRIKQMDSSQFEYQDAYSEFYTNLNRFRNHYVIPDEYKNTNTASNRYQDDFSLNPWLWDKGTPTSGPLEG